MMLPTRVASQITPFLQGIDQDLRPPFNQEKSLIYTSNYRKSSIFNLQPQNRITKTIQLLKAGKFDSLGDFEGGFILFYKN